MSVRLYSYIRYISTSRDIKNKTKRVNLFITLRDRHVHRVRKKVPRRGWFAYFNRITMMK